MIVCCICEQNQADKLIDGRPFCYGHAVKVSTSLIKSTITTTTDPEFWRQYGLGPDTRSTELM